MTKHIDNWIILASTGLALFGIFNIFGIKQELFLSQIIFFIVGILLLLLFFRIGIAILKLNGFIFYILFIVGLLTTFIIGGEVRGSRRWIDFYFFSFQTSEFMKPFFILFLSQFFSKPGRHSFKTHGIALVAVIIPIFIIFKQPDLGNAIVYVATYLGILFLIGLSWRLFMHVFVSAVLIFPIAWRFLADYQKNRLLGFIQPHIDPQGISYNLIQSVITVGSGGFLGRGLGLSTQAKFLFLPENHTDFAFASLVEQFGFLGGIIVVGLFLVIIYRLVKKAFLYRSNSFEFLFLMGTVLMFLTQVFINLGMNLGLVPVTGVALPLISYGGSSIVSTLILLGLAMSI